MPEYSEFIRIPMRDFLQILILENMGIKIIYIAKKCSTHEQSKV